MVPIDFAGVMYGMWESLLSSYDWKLIPRQLLIATVTTTFQLLAMLECDVHASTPSSATLHMVVALQRHVMRDTHNKTTALAHLLYY